VKATTYYTLEGIFLLGLILAWFARPAPPEAVHPTLYWLLLAAVLLNLYRNVLANMIFLDVAAFTKSGFPIQYGDYVLRLLISGFLFFGGVMLFEYVTLFDLSPLEIVAFSLVGAPVVFRFWHTLYGGTYSGAHKAFVHAHQTYREIDFWQILLYALFLVMYYLPPPNSNFCEEELTLTLTVILCVVAVLDFTRNGLYRVHRRIAFDK